MEYEGNGIYNSRGKAIRVEGSLRGVPNTRRKSITAPGKFASGGRTGGLPRKRKRGR